jgi:hypothetical protein
MNKQKARFRRSYDQGGKSVTDKPLRKETAETNEAQIAVHWKEEEY